MMWIRTIFGLLLFIVYHSSSVSSMPETRREFGTRFKQAITDAIKKFDDLTTTCPPGSFFYNGSCFFYLSAKSMALTDLSVNEASERCQLLRSKLWDIESIEEFDYILARIYVQTQSFDSPRIAVNFTDGKGLLQLKKSTTEQQYLNVGNNNDYSLIYKPLSDVPSANTSLIIDISRATHRISLEEKFRLERRSNHYICKMKINSCYNNTRCGRHGQCRNLVVKYQCVCNFMYTGEFCHQLSNRGVQSIAAACFICLTLLFLLTHSIWNSFERLKEKQRNYLMNINTKTTSMSAHHRPHREKFYSIPNVSSDRLISSTIHVASDTIIDCSTKARSSMSIPAQIFFHHSFIFYVLRAFVVILSLGLATISCQTIYQMKISNLKSFQQIENTTHEKTPSGICRLFQTKLNIYYKIPANYVSLGVLLLLIVLLIVFENISTRKKRTLKSFCQKFSMPMIFNSHSHIYRFQSAAVFGIIALEILHIFDEYIVHGSDHFQHGPLADLLIQFGLGLMLGLRYFPILAIFEKENIYEDRLENSVIYGLAAIYLYSEIIFKVQSDINCAVDQRKFSVIKETFSKLNRMGVDVKEYFSMQITSVNRTATWFNGTTDSNNDDIENELKRLNYSLELNKESIFYNILRNAPYYYFIVYLAVCLTILFFRTVLGHVEKSSMSYKNWARWKYVKFNLFQSSRSEQRQYSRLFRILNSFILIFKEYVYEHRAYFRYSKLIICIYTSGFTLIYYFTFWIQDHTYLLTKKLLLFLNLILCGLADLSKDLCYNLNLTTINRDIEMICLLTAFITCLQLFFGLRHYQRQMCAAYRGSFNDIPTTTHMSSVSIISKSIHYPGRFIGSLVYSYGFLFIFISIFYILSRYIFYSFIVLEFLSKLVLPMLIFFLFQMLSVRLLCKLLFIQNSHFLALRNLRLYYTFSYFSFFFDCFLGFLTCLTRISKAFVCALVFFARLDYSPYGRGLELFDSSYASYVSFFHVERNQRHPVLNVFIDIIRQRLIDRRKLLLKSTGDDLTSLEEHQRLIQLRRFRWALAYTLIRNEHLKRFRKHRLSSTRTIQSRTLERLFDRIGLSQTLPKKF